MLSPPDLDSGHGDVYGVDVVEVEKMLSNTTLQSQQSELSSSHSHNGASLTSIGSLMSGAGAHTHWLASLQVEEYQTIDDFPNTPHTVLL